MILFALMACDKIEEPLKPAIFNCGDCEAADDDPFITNPNVLIEEFTGHTCNNCPTAATEVKRLIDENPGRVFTIGIHAGGFSIPQPPDYPSDFRTTEGDELFQFANPAGVPVGLVNRVDFNTPVFNKLSGKWAQETEDILKGSAAKMGMIIETVVDTATRELCLTAKFKALEDLTNVNLRWCAFITEGKIVAPQKMPDNSKNKDYVHEHVLRVGINGTFGSDFQDFTGVKDQVTCETRSYVLSEEWNLEHLEVVVYVYENETDSRAILQVLAADL